MLDAWHPDIPLELQTGFPTSLIRTAANAVGRDRRLDLHLAVQHRAFIARQIGRGIGNIRV